MNTTFQRAYRFSTPGQTSDFAARLAPVLTCGDVILLQGDLGAGKTHFARGLIQARLALADLVEDVPSPTFTLVQTYSDGQTEIWHADLYRLTSEDEVYELGLDDAFTEAVCLIEWPDRLGDLTPKDALTLEFSMTERPGERLLSARSGSGRWQGLLESIDG